MVVPLHWAKDIKNMSLIELSRDDTATGYYIKHFFWAWWMRWKCLIQCHRDIWWIFSCSLKIDPKDTSLFEILFDRSGIKPNRRTALKTCMTDIEVNKSRIHCCSAFSCTHLKFEINWIKIGRDPNSC